MSERNFVSYKIPSANGKFWRFLQTWKIGIKTPKRVVLYGSCKREFSSIQITRLDRRQVLRWTARTKKPRTKTVSMCHGASVRVGNGLVLRIAFGGKKITTRPT